MEDRFPLFVGNDILFLAKEGIPMSYLIYGNLSQLKGEMAVDPLSLTKGKQSRATRDILTSAKSQLLDDEIKKQKLGIGKLFETQGYHSPYKKILHVVLPYAKDDPTGNVLRMIYQEIFSYCLDKKVQELYLPVLGIDTQGYEESEALALGKDECTRFLLNHKGIDISLVLPLPGADIPVIKKVPLVAAANPPLIVIDNTKIKTYWDYFLTYLEERKNVGYPIPEILSEKDLHDKLFGDGISDSMMGKWKAPQKIKGKKSTYYPAPSKSTLFLIILTLGMSYEEAENCFFFFGYGLTPFDPIEAFYLDILKNPREEIDIINAQLIQQFGKKASLFLILDK
jgi:hypothetical protein